MKCEKCGNRSWTNSGEIWALCTNCCSWQVQEKTKEQNMKRNFRAGDKVTMITTSRGTIKEINESNGFPIFDYEKNLEIEVNHYHGHNVTFEVHGEEVPKRTVKRYVNIAWSITSKDVVHGYLYKTAEEAKKSSSARDLITAMKIEIPEDEV